MDASDESKWLAFCLKVEQEELGRSSSDVTCSSCLDTVTAAQRRLSFLPEELTSSLSPPSQTGVQHSRNPDVLCTCVGADTNSNPASNCGTLLVPTSDKVWHDSYRGGGNGKVCSSEQGISQKEEGEKRAALEGSPSVQCVSAIQRGEDLLQAKVSTARESNTANPGDDAPPLHEVDVQAQASRVETEPGPVECLSLSTVACDTGSERRAADRTPKTAERPYSPLRRTERILGSRKYRPDCNEQKADGALRTGLSPRPHLCLVGRQTGTHADQPKAAVFTALDAREPPTDKLNDRPFTGHESGALPLRAPGVVPVGSIRAPAAGADQYVGQGRRASRSSAGAQMLGRKLRLFAEFVATKKQKDEERVERQKSVQAILDLAAGVYVGDRRRGSRVLQDGETEGRPRQGSRIHGQTVRRVPAGQHLDSAELGTREGSVTGPRLADTTNERVEANELAQSYAHATSSQATGNCPHTGAAPGDPRLSSAVTREERHISWLNPQTEPVQRESHKVVEFADVALQSATPRDTTRSAGGSLESRQAAQLLEQYVAALQSAQTAWLRAQRERVDTQRFRVLRVLGVGAYGVVRLVQDLRTGEKFALKQMKKSAIKLKNERTRLYAERHVLAGVVSRHVVKLECSFQDKDYLYQVLEYLPGGDLMTHLVSCGQFSEETTKFYIAQLILAVHTVHRLGYMHRDIKPCNIVLDDKGNLKLLDFGLCTHYKPSSPTSPPPAASRQKQGANQQERNEAPWHSPTVSTAKQNYRNAPTDWPLKSTGGNSLSGEVARSVCDAHPSSPCAEVGPYTKESLCCSSKPSENHEEQTFVGSLPAPSVLERSSSAPCSFPSERPSNQPAPADLPPESPSTCSAARSSRNCSSPSQEFPLDASPLNRPPSPAAPRESSHPSPVSSCGPSGGGNSESAPLSPPLNPEESRVTSCGPSLPYGAGPPHSERLGSCTASHAGAHLPATPGVAVSGEQSPSHSAEVSIPKAEPRQPGGEPQAPGESKPADPAAPFSASASSSPCHISRFEALSQVGTPHYMAPEVLAGQPYSFSADWWSVGVILFECIYGGVPFNTPSYNPQLLSFIIVNFRRFFIFPKQARKRRRVSAACIEVIRGLISEKEARWGFDELKKCEWLRDVDWEALSRGEDWEKKEKKQRAEKGTAEVTLLQDGSSRAKKSTAAPNESTDRTQGKTPEQAISGRPATGGAPTTGAERKAQAPDREHEDSCSAGDGGSTKGLEKPGEDDSSQIPDCKSATAEEANREDFLHTRTSSAVHRSSSCTTLDKDDGEKTYTPFREAQTLPVLSGPDTEVQARHEPSGARGCDPIRPPGERHAGLHSRLNLEGKDGKEGPQQRTGPQKANLRPCVSPNLHQDALGVSLSPTENSPGHVKRGALQGVPQLPEGPQRLPGGRGRETDELSFSYAERRFNERGSLADALPPFQPKEMKRLATKAAADRFLQDCMEALRPGGLGQAGASSLAAKAAADADVWINDALHDRPRNIVGPDYVGFPMDVLQGGGIGSAHPLHLEPFEARNEVLKDLHFLNFTFKRNEKDTEARVYELEAKIKELVGLEIGKNQTDCENIGDSERNPRKPRSECRS